MTSAAQVTTTDGRVLEVLVDGPADALPVVLHSGTPSGPVPSPERAEAAAAAGLRLVTYGRPGYGRSDPAPGRRVADAAADTAAVLDALGAGEFVTAGISGGGPHALACAALLPERCRAAATIAGAAPYTSDGLDFTAGMGEDNVEEFGLAVQGAQALRPWLERQAQELASVQAQGVVEALAGLLPPVDVASLTGVFAEQVAASFRKAVERGVEGWLDDDLAFVDPWGFDLADIGVPVAVWQGDQDLMVPFAHGQHLAGRVPTATPHLLPGHGHLSLSVEHLPAVFADLAALAR